MYSLHNKSSPACSIRASPRSFRLPQVSCWEPREALRKPHCSKDTWIKRSRVGIQLHRSESKGGTRRASVKTMAAMQDLLIVGPGVLGCYLGKLWIDQGGNVIGQTNSTSNHDRLRKLGITPRTNNEASGSFSNVVFSAPPSGGEDFVGDIRKALTMWNGEGSFVYTSSTAVYSPPKDSVKLTEDSNLESSGKSEKTDRLLQAESTVLAEGGNVARLSGLYHANRGAHSYFLKVGQVDRWGGYTLNLIHYEDAASLVFQVLSRGAKHRGQVFLGYDEYPVTFHDMMQAVTSSPAFSGEVEFTGEAGENRGKALDSSKTLDLLDREWSPKYKGIVQFMKDGAKDWYTESALF